MIRTRIDSTEHSLIFVRILATIYHMRLMKILLHKALQRDCLAKTESGKQLSFETIIRVEKVVSEQVQSYW